VRAFVVAVGLLVTACAQDAEREPEERRNLAAMRTIPVPPGAVIVSTETFGEHAPDRSDGPIVAWPTVRALRLARAVEPAGLVDTSRRGLRRAGWEVLDGADFYLNARRGGTCLHLLTSPEPPPPPDAPIPSAEAGGPVPNDRFVRGLVLKVSDC
jgi:hypothetical protein